MNAQTKISLFRSDSRPTTLKKFLKKDLGISSQFIKKIEMPRAYLEKELFHRDEIELPFDLINRKMVNPLYEGPPVIVLHEDENFLALHKPCGVHLHPLLYSDKLNLLSYLRSAGKKSVLGVAPETHEKGWLYRLDRETSGVVVAAKNQETYDLYRQQFSALVTQKRYFCLVQGECDLDGSYTLFYDSHAKKGSMIRASEQQDSGKRGDFHIKKIYSQKDYHLLQVDLKTGLRHQIRAGLAFLGYPILGDELYGGPKASRLMLHAFQYRLQRKGKEDLVLTSSLLSGFDAFLDLDSLLEMLHEKSLIS